MSTSEKRAVIDPGDKALSISRQCEWIGLPRASFYRNSSNGESSENLKLMGLIDEEYPRHPFYGTRKMTQRRKGFLPMGLWKTTAQFTHRAHRLYGYKDYDLTTYIF